MCECLCEGAFFRQGKADGRRHRRRRRQGVPEWINKIKEVIKFEEIGGRGLSSEVNKKKLWKKKTKIK